mgnify:CR=1 FL=1
MVFSSITFLYFFLPVLLLVYYIIPKKYRNLVLLIFSLLFYFYGERNLVLVGSCVMNYFFGIFIGKEQSKDKKKSKLYLTIGIICNVLLLGYYKYTNFFIENISNLFRVSISTLDVVLPLGISFFTFQNISYLADVYRGEVQAPKSIIRYGTYITLFPQLIAGPIVRYRDVCDELYSRKETFKQFSQGIYRLMIGVAKKVLVANILAKMCLVLGGMESKTVLSYIIEALGYTFQIYFDFSGYSDMAIGLGLMFGFNFKENFDYPLFATSVTEFWRRWHMSLTSFLRDYVYIPLGGNKVSKLKWFRNILTVWLLTGFWHGANWNFIIWGLYFFVFLMIEKNFLYKFLKKGILSHLYTVIVVVIGFVIFNNESLPALGNFLKCMTGFGSLEFISAETIYNLKNYALILIVACITSTPIFKYIGIKLKEKKNGEKIIFVFKYIFSILVLVVSTATLLSSSFNPFIYFRF